MERLDEVEQKYAEEHHNLVYKFLHTKGLDMEQYYDVVIFGYLEAVQEYNTKPALKQYSISTIAWRKMNFALYDYYTYQNRQKRRANLVELDRERKTYSLSEVFPDRNTQITETIEDQFLVAEALSYLTEKEREVVHLKSYGYSYTEIAAFIRISSSGVSSRFERLRKRLMKRSIVIDN